MKNNSKIFVAKEGTAIVGQTYASHNAVPDGAIAIFDASVYDSSGTSHHSDILTLPNTLPREFVIVQGVNDPSNTYDDNIHQTARLHRKRLCRVTKTVPRAQTGEVYEITDIPANCCGSYTLLWFEWTEYTKLQNVFQPFDNYEKCNCVCEPAPNDSLVTTLTALMNHYNSLPLFPFTVTVNPAQTGLILTAKDLTKTYDLASDNCLKCATITTIQEGQDSVNTGVKIAKLEKLNRTWYGKSGIPNTANILNVYENVDFPSSDTAYQRLFTDPTKNYITFDLEYRSNPDEEVFPAAQETIITLAYVDGTDVSALDTLFQDLM